VLAYLRTGETFADLAAGFAVSTATAWRYVHEAVALLSARPPNWELRCGPRSGTSWRSWSWTAP